MSKINMHVVFDTLSGKLDVKFKDSLLGISPGKLQHLFRKLNFEFRRHQREESAKHQVEAEAARAKAAAEAEAEAAQKVAVKAASEAKLKKDEAGNAVARLKAIASNGENTEEKETEE